MPNAFSPNNDNLNDVFRVPIDSDIQLEEFSVFNRWGGLVFQNTDATKGWDGTLKGQPMPSGTYIYMIRARRNNAIQLFKGTVQLVR